jgi:sugar/nucleoside kinase (ribokinase family)
VAGIAVVGNATHDVIETGLVGSRRAGGTVLYASIALHRLGHDVQPIGHAPLRAYLAARRAGLNRSRLRLALRATKFKNVYENGQREQWASAGVGTIEGPLNLTDHEAVLLGAVLGELPDRIELPEGPVLVDLQGQLRSLGETDLWGWQRVEPATPPELWPGVTHVRGSIEELAPWLSTRDPAQAARRLHEHVDRTAIVTMGSKGAVAYDGTLQRARPDPVDTDDPTGAGDVFDAGLLQALVHGRGLDQALNTACSAASRFLATGGGLNPNHFPPPASIEP